MNFLTHRDEQELQLQMTPMVDVVFQLLAFFVLGCQFRMTEHDCVMGHTRSPQAIIKANAADFPTEIPITLRRSGTTVAISVGQTALKEGDFTGIRHTLAQINAPSIAVRILADPTLTVDEVAQALDAVLASPMTQVSVSQLQVRTVAANARQNTEPG